MPRSNRLYGGCSTCSGATRRNRSIWPTEKLLTPMARIFPCSNSACIASAVSSIVTNESGAAGIAKYSSILPLKSGLAGNDHVRAQPAFDRLANNLLGAAKSIDRGRVDNVDTMVDCGPDGSDGYSLVGSAPHPPADGPGADRNVRHLERRAGNARAFHVHFESFCLTDHDRVPSLSACLRHLGGRRVHPQSVVTEGTA